ncbi:hypothetical protein R3W88_014793 [Solanum pinnatisectum]|uniref:Uncharacterized protein n=1 Tax=Solanum pinnatisectum TaxID=50273 RepID=A0AAV9KSN6_9SOLN|nr:hypothetical protein R3W88_014793 [Solanum pinnatisectum]
MAFRKSSVFSYKDSTGVVSADLSHVGPITHHKFKNSGLDGSEYFISLEMIKTNNSHTMVVTATPRGNLAFVFFGEFYQIGSNFGESEDLMDSPTSMNVNALMDDSTDTDEKFAMMEQTIEALKKSIDDKTLHIAQLMNNHVPTCPPGFDARNKDVEESLMKSKFQKEKQSASVAALSIQQLQDMIINTIRANHASVAPNQKKCSRSQSMPNTTFLQFGSLTPIEIDNHQENEAYGWTLVTHKKRRHQTVLRIQLPKTRATRSNVNQLQSSKSVKPCTSQKINGFLSQNVRRPITLDEFFLEKFFCGSHIGATHVVSNTYEMKENKGKHNATITQEHQANEKVALCCATIAFTDDDLLLGSKLHNRPLFVVGSIR